MTSTNKRHRISSVNHTPLQEKQANLYVLGEHLKQERQREKQEREKLQ